MCSINTFIFDLDGTLLDSVPDLAIALNRMLIAYNRSTYAENTIRQWVGNGARKLVERGLIAGEVNVSHCLTESEIDSALECFLSFYRESFSKNSTLYPGVSGTLNALKASGYSLALVSNKPVEFIPPILREFSLSSFCPEPGANSIVDNLLGDLERTPGTNGREFGCIQTTPIIDDDGNENFREVSITAPINVSDTITVEGYELAIQQKLDFLPYPWNGFGGVFNYTSLDQKGSEVELTRVSPESFNVITYWENDGISLRLSYNWRDDQTLRGANSFLGTNARTRKAIGRLDFVGSYALNDDTKVFLRAFNLTDEIGEEYLGTDERAISRLTYTGRIYQVAVNYKF